MFPAALDGAYGFLQSVDSARLVLPYDAAVAMLYSVKVAQGAILDKQQQRRNGVRAVRATNDAFCSLCVEQ